MQEFCKIYTKTHKTRKHPFGFGDGAVGMIFEHGCPNNAPVVVVVQRTRVQASVS